MPVNFSVALIVGDRRERAVRSLKSLVSQNVVDRMEILVYDIARSSHPPLPDSNHPQVRVVKAPGLTYARARVRAIHEATGPVIGFLEEHAWAFDGWADAILAAHDEGWTGVGAEVHVGNPGVKQSMLIGLMNHHPWLAPAERGPRPHLAGHNSAYKREVLLRYGDRLLDLVRAELALNRALTADGHKLFLENKAKFAHINETGIDSISRGYYLWNRCYGYSRAKQFDWSLFRRLTYAACTPIMPFYFLAHTLPTIYREQPKLFPLAMRGIPRLVAAQMASAVGHSAGVLFGLGDAEERFSIYETTEYRQTEQDADHS